MEKILNWLNQKSYEDTVFTQFLKFGYAVGRNSWIHALTSALLGIFIPIFYSSKNTLFFIIFLFILISDCLYAALCNEYQKSRYAQRNFSSESLVEQSSLLKSIVIEMENNPNWKNTIFKTVSGLTCEKIYTSFKEILNCETRVSIEYIFDKHFKSSNSVEKHVKMSGRRSGNRSTVKKSVPLNKRNKYFSYKIFINNNKGINILTQNEIDDTNTWYKNPNNNTEVKKYIGIAVCINDETNVKFIVQIDCLNDVYFGKDNSREDVKKFIEQYLMSYINIISISYLLNLNGKREISEV